MTTHRFFRKIAALTAAAALTLSAGLAMAEEKVFKLDVGGIEAPGSGSIKGVVKFNGEQRARKAIDMSANKDCSSIHGDKAPLAENFVFGDNSTLQHVFVYVSKGLEGKGPFKSEAKPEIDQIGCVYVPHVQGMVAGQELLILNGDNTLHNVKYSTQNNGAANDGMPAKGMKLPKKFVKPEMAINFKCDVHSWMNSYVHVMEHPFFAVTQQAGTFEIKGLPPGDYEISTWHELKSFKADQASYKVKVEAGKAAEVTVIYAPPAAK